ncbi:hypothetical protein U3516DRAFT_602534 [Neocallimastix sp. 'constans']|jgi:hypothetical protein
MKSEVDNTSLDQENVSTATEEKEKICKFFNSKRGCVKGENCDFLHIKIDKKDSKKVSEKKNDKKSENNDNENNGESKKSKRNDKKGKKDKTNESSGENGNKKICKFFNTPEGCRKGDKCQFLHIKTEGNVDNDTVEESNKSNKNDNNKNNKSNTNNNKNNKNNKNNRGQNNNNKEEEKDTKADKPATPNNEEDVQTVRISYPKNFNNNARKPMARPQPKIPKNKSERDIEIDQLERRYRTSFKMIENIPAYTKVAFDFSPTDPEFPFELESMNVELLIPMTYPIGACKMTKITNNDIPPHLINNIINMFNRKANIKPRLPLVNLMNWLDFNLEDLLINKPQEPSVVISFVSNTKKPEDEVKESENKDKNNTDSNKEKEDNDDENSNDNEEEEEDDDNDDDENNSVDLNDIDFDNQISDDDDEEEDDDQDALYSENKNNNLTHGYEEEDNDVDIEEGDENENAIRPTALSSEVPKGIHIRLPNIKITGISLLQCVGLSVTLKCDRCRNTIDFYEVRPMGQLKLRSTNNKEENKKEEEKPYIVNSVYWKHCKTCRQAIGIRYRSEYLTPFSLAIGYIDLEGCMPFDFLPSNFVIQCDKCNTDQPAINGVKRSQDNDVFCKKCYNHMVLNIDLIRYVKFAQTEKLDDEGLPSATRVKLRKKKEKEQSLGIILGQPLPNKGVCEHYKKSYRWFRFPCCGKIFPCDICHDNHSDHESKWANRMICGFCSKEQPFSDKDCSCGKSLTKKAVSHWEGGKGNRDSSTMNKRDKQKYSGMNKTISKKAQKKMDAKKSKKNKK